MIWGRSQTLGPNTKLLILIQGLGSPATRAWLHLFSLPGMAFVQLTDIPVLLTTEAVFSTKPAWLLSHSFPRWKLEVPQAYFELV